MMGAATIFLPPGGSGIEKGGGREMMGAATISVPLGGKWGKERLELQPSNSNHSIEKQWYIIKARFFHEPDF
jgi:hypothetical protein